jgi:hypothetical protein
MIELLKVLRSLVITQGGGVPNSCAAVLHVSPTQDLIDAAVEDTQRLCVVADACGDPVCRRRACLAAACAWLHVDEERCREALRLLNERTATHDRD